MMLVFIQAPQQDPDLAMAFGLERKAACWLLNVFLGARDSDVFARMWTKSWSAWMPATRCWAACGGSTSNFRDGILEIIAISVCLNSTGGTRVEAFVWNRRHLRDEVLRYR